MKDPINITSNRKPILIHY